MGVRRSHSRHVGSFVLEGLRDLFVSNVRHASQTAFQRRMLGRALAHDFPLYRLHLPMPRKLIRDPPGAAAAITVIYASSGRPFTASSHNS
jgi:hypothetical protein